MCQGCGAVVRARRSVAWGLLPFIVGLVVTIWLLWLAGFNGQGLFSLTVFVYVPVSLVFLRVNAWLFPRELDLIWLPPDPPEAGQTLYERRPEPEPVPAPWVPRLQTIEPPITFAGIAITVLMIVVFGYNGWIAIDAVVARLTAP